MKIANTYILAESFKKNNIPLIKASYLQLT